MANKIKILFKTALIALILFLMPLNAYAAPSFQIVEDFVNISSNAGTTASGNFVVNNTGTTNLNINFTGYLLSSENNQISIVSLANISNLANGTTSAATFSVQIPTQQKAGIYSAILNATSNATPSATVEDSVIINLNVTPTYTVSTVSEIFLGDVNLNSTYAKSFNITNTGNSNITNVSFGFSGSNFDLKTNKTNFVLPFNSTESLAFNITVPFQSSTGNVTLGSVKILSTELNADLFNVKADVKAGLVIEDLDVFLTTFDSKTESDLDVINNKKLDFGEEDIGPGSELRFNFEISNTFRQDAKIDIKDAIIKVTIADIDDNADLDEESQEFDIDSGGSEDVDVIITIPLSVEPGKYDVLIEAEGEDEDRNTHSAKMSLVIDVKKKSRDIEIIEASIFPEKIKCSGASALTAKIKNLGSRNEDDARLEIINSDLGINFAQGKIMLENAPFEGTDEFVKKLGINVDNTNNKTKAGKYAIAVKAYLQEQILWKTKTVNLVVEACEKSEEKKAESKEENIKKGIAQQETSNAISAEKLSEKAENEIQALKPAASTEIPFTQKPLFWAGVIIFNVIIIFSVVFFVSKMFVKK
ncbi:hypothetical protein HYX01_01640 [Candidatus Woesearchaeota archaeon]|nr:hypothetical protein [Candidatus Woesearchaeota archaeon]